MAGPDEVIEQQLPYRSAIPSLDPSQIRADFQGDARLAKRPWAQDFRQPGLECLQIMP